eukprot:gene16231-22397_t
MEVGELPGHTGLDMADIDTPLHISCTNWLKKRGKAVRSKLTDQQKAELLECFKLMDEDGSGAIDGDELGAAFKLLGMKMTKREVEEVVHEADHSGTRELEYLEILEVMTNTLYRLSTTPLPHCPSSSGELGYPEFLEVMTNTLHRLSELPEDDGEGDSRIPFALMSTAYRRKKIMEGIMCGDRATLDQIVCDSEASLREKERLAKMAEIAATKADHEAERNKGQPKRLAVKVAKKTHLSVNVLGVNLGQDELKCIARIAGIHNDECRFASRAGSQEIERRHKPQASQALSQAGSLQPTSPGLSSPMVKVVPSNSPMIIFTIFAAKMDHHQFVRGMFNHGLSIAFIFRSKSSHLIPR